MKVLIVDDEFNSRRIVRKLLAEKFPDLVFLNDASGVEEAQVIIQEDRPDIVLLDIQMNASTGFELLSNLKERTFEVVFITAYDNYALKAFDFGAASYVLKPIDREKLFVTIEKLIEQVSLKQNKSLPADREVNQMEKLILPSGESSIVVEVKNIIYARADGMYCELYLKEVQGKILIVKPLNYLETKLDGHPHFIRVHKSYLINMNAITKISGDRTSLLLGDISIPIARLRKEELKEKLKNSFY